MNLRTTFTVAHLKIQVNGSQVLFFIMQPMKRKRLAAGVATDLTDRYVLFHEERISSFVHIHQILMIKSVASP